MKVKKYLFMVDKLVNDLFVRGNTYKITVDASGQLGYYYFDFEEEFGKLNKLLASLDADGVPLNRAYIDVNSDKLHYYPISIGQYALAVFHTWLRTKAEDKKAHFLRIADWFMKQAIEDNGLGVYWLTDVPKPEYKVFTPWKSAFSQSRGLSVLLRAWQITGNVAYREMASKALIPYTKDVRDGGVAAWLREGHPFYEEYTAEGPTMVLDGHNFSLLGVMDYIRAVPQDLDPENHALAVRIFEDGINSLIHWLPQYDLGWWLRFNLCKLPHYPTIDPCTVNYFRLVLLQLELLQQLSGREELGVFVKKFRKYDSFPHIIRMYLLKYKALKQLKRL